MHPRSLAERQGPCIPRSLLALAHLFMAALRASDPSPSALSESPSIPPRARGRADRRSRPNWPVLRALHTFSARATTRARSSFPFGRRVRDASGKKRSLDTGTTRPCKSESCCPSPHCNHDSLTIGTIQCRLARDWPCCFLAR